MGRQLASLAALCWVGLLATELEAQTPYLVADIDPAEIGSAPSGFTAVGATVFFAAADDDTGRELWKTDGTTAGTVLVSDIEPGPEGSEPVRLTAFGAEVLFCTNSRGGLWKSDGTAAGTLRLNDAVRCASITVVGGLAYFSGRGADGAELWSTDGTAAGTRQVADINPGSAGSYPDRGYAFDGELYFSAYERSSGRELWRSDGTAAGTRLVADVSPPGSLTDQVWPLADVGGRLFVGYTTEGLSCGLYATDGTEPLLPVAASCPWFVPFGAEVNGGLAFAGIDRSAGERALWWSDGTEPGTYERRPLSSWLAMTEIVSDGGQVWFVHDRSLFVSDGTAAGTRGIRGLSGGIWSVRPVPGGALFLGDDGVRGVELWRSDGTFAGTEMVADICPGGCGSVNDLAVVGGRAYFGPDDGATGAEPWTSDGTATGTALLADLAQVTHPSWPQRLTAIGDRVFFSAETRAEGREPWVSDGTAAGTVRLVDMCPGACGTTVHYFTPLGDKVFFATLREGLWETDGTSQGTALVSDTGPSPGLATQLTAYGDRLYYLRKTPATGGSELWQSDGTPAGTTLVKDLGAVGVDGTTMLALPDGFVFDADDALGRRQLWRSDGTAAGTVRVDVGVELSIHGFSRLGWHDGELLFNAYDADWEVGLWRYDGVAPATRLAAESGSSIRVADRIYFGVKGNPFYRLWQSDGRSASRHPSSWIAWSGAKLPGAALGDELLIVGVGSSRSQLYRTDGTEVGTVRLTDIDPDAGRVGGEIVVAGSVAYFAADDGVSGLELWQTDGTPVGTWSLGDIRSGPASALDWSGFAVVRSGAHNQMPLDATRVFFVADDGAVGRELWAVDVVRSQPALLRAALRDAAGSAVGARLPLTVEHDHYLSFVNPGSVDPDADIVVDQTRPLTAYALTDASPTLRLVKDGAGSLVIDF